MESGWLTEWGYILIALAGAGLYAVASVLEQYEAGKQDESKAMKVGLLVSLAKRPLWLLGLALDGGGFALQAWALSLGPVAIVQPVLVTSLLFALPLGVKYTGQRIGRNEWIGAVVVTVSLAAFVAAADVDKGDTTHVSGGDWILASAIVGGLAVACIVAGWKASAPVKAALWGSAGGLLWGIMAVYLQTTTDLWDERSLLAVLETWYPYAVIAAGAIGMLMAQSAFQTGKLAPSMATFSSIDPIVGVVLGVWLFGQRLHSDVLAREAIAVVALAVMVVGIVILSRSKLVAAGSGALEADDDMLKSARPASE